MFGIDPSIIDFMQWNDLRPINKTIAENIAESIAPDPVVKQSARTKAIADSEKSIMLNFITYSDMLNITYKTPAEKATAYQEYRKQFIVS